MYFAYSLRNIKKPHVVDLRTGRGHDLPATQVGSVSIGGRPFTNFRFADDIVVNAEEEEEAGVLVDSLDTTTTRYKMEIGPDKTNLKVMTNNPNDFQREIKIKGQRLEEVENFKYLGAIISNEGSKPEILSRIAQQLFLH